MLRWLALVLPLVMLVPAPSPAGAWAHGSPCTLAPAPAQSAGYCSQTYAASGGAAFTASTVDKNATYAHGFQWYPLNWNTKSGPAQVTFNGDGSMTQGGGGGTTGFWLLSATKQNSAPYFIGTAYGCGFYYQATVKSPGLGDTTSWPAVWAQSIESFTSQFNGSAHWPGQIANYNHFEEIDLMEEMAGATTFNLHDWWGVQSTDQYPPNSETNGLYTPRAGGFFTSSHTWGALWIPATGQAQGSITIYLDGTALRTVSYDQFVATNCQNNSTQCPPATGQSWAQGIVDTQHLAIILDGGPNSAMTTYDVQVWQNPATMCNVSN